MGTNKMDAIGIGRCCVDVILNIPTAIKENSTAVISQKSVQGGGKSATAAATLAKLGASAGFVGVVGSDQAGDFCFHDLQRLGVDTSQMIADEGKSSGISIVISDQEKFARNILCVPSSCRKIQIDDIREEYIKNAGILFLESQSCPIDVSIHCARIAKKHGLTTIFDGDAYEENQKELLPFIDVFIGSEHYYTSVFKDQNHDTNCRQFMKAGPRIVVFTFGAKGCSGCEGDHSFHIPAFRVEVSDTLGAGDVFHGAFAYGLLKQWSPYETARFASAVSAIKCTRIGGRAGIPSVRNVMEFMKTGRIDYTEIDNEVVYYANQKSFF